MQAAQLIIGQDLDVEKWEPYFAETRLRILRIIAEHGEQRSQEIMEALDLSQSVASRHLSQLSASGFINERRCESAKCYALNPERVSDTLQVIASFLLSKGYRPGIKPSC
jgi:DNA-binding MarR family transcriptional regulator